MRDESVTERQYSIAHDSEGGCITLKINDGSYNLDIFIKIHEMLNKYNLQATTLHLNSNRYSEITIIDKGGT